MMNEKKRIYVTTQDIRVSGSYEELIDDRCPGIGTYFQNETFVIPKNCRISLNEKGCIAGADMEFNGYGASMYTGTVHMNHPLSLLPEGAVKEITEEEWNKIQEHETAYEEWCFHEEACEGIDYRMHCGFDEEVKRVVTVEDYEAFSEDIWKQCDDYIKNMVRAMDAWGRMKQCMA